MATEAVKARNYRRRLKIQQNYQTRQMIKEIILNPNTDEDNREKNISKLNKRSRNESYVRLRHRCRLCGRPRGVYRKFGLCRLCLRKAAMRGDVPGLVKASW